MKTEITVIYHVIISMIFLISPGLTTNFIRSFQPSLKQNIFLPKVHIKHERCKSYYFSVFKESVIMKSIFFLDKSKKHHIMILFIMCLLIVFFLMILNFSKKLKKEKNEENISFENKALLDDDGIIRIKDCKIGEFVSKLENMREEKKPLVVNDMIIRINDCKIGEFLVKLQNK